MSNAALTASFILKLEDQLSAGLTKLMKLLDRVTSVGAKVGLPGLEAAGRKLDTATNATQRFDRTLEQVGRTAGSTGRSIAEMVSGAESRLSRLAARARGTFSGAFNAGRNLGHNVGVVGAAGAGLAMAAPIHAYADYDTLLRQLAVTEGLRGKMVAPEMARLDKFFREDALRTGQTSKSIAEAAQDLLVAGISMKTVLELLPAHSMAATAYNITPEAMGQAVMALNQQFGVGEGDIRGALASLALATKSGKFNIQDMSRFLPQVGGAMNLLGMRGRGSADMAFAALETVRMNTGDASTAATNFTDLLHYITSPMAVRSFAHQGINLPAMLADARKKGISPLMAVLGKVQERVRGQTPEQMSLTLGKLFHNQQAGDAAKALILNADHFIALMNKLKGADPAMLGEDFRSMLESPGAQLRLLGEDFSELGRRIGEGLLPMLHGLIGGLEHVIAWVDALDGADRALLNTVIGVVGWITLLVGVLGTIGFLAPAVQSGFMLLVALFKLLMVPLSFLATSVLPVLWMVLTSMVETLMTLAAVLLSPEMLLAALAVAIGAMLINIVTHWERFRDQFGEVWDGINRVVNGAFAILVGLATLDGAQILDGLRAMRDGVVNIFSGLFGVIKQLFVDFWNTLASIPGAEALGIHRIGDKGADAGDRGAQMKYGDAERLHMSQPRQEVHVTVSADEGLRARVTGGAAAMIDPAHPRGFGLPPTGPTTSRP